MIDTFNEDIISIDDADKHVARLSRKKRNRAKIIRWANRGVAGVRLRTISIGGEIFTSKQALNEFLNESRLAKQKRHSQSTSKGIQSSRQAQQDADQAEELGI